MARSPGIYPWDSGRRLPSPPRAEARGYVPAPTRGEMREHQVGAVLRRLPPTSGGYSAYRVTKSRSTRSPASWPTSCAAPTYWST